MGWYSQSLIIKNMSIFVCLISALSLFAGSDLSAQVIIEDRLSVSAQQYDFGTVGKDKKEVSHTFYIKNISGETISIYSVRPDCDCVKVKYSRRHMKNNETARVTVIRTVDYPGSFRNYISLVISGMKKPVVFRIKGEIGQ